MEQIIADSMFAEGQLLRNLTIGHSFCDQLYHVFLALRQWSGTHTGKGKFRHLRESINEIAQMQTVRPNLTGVDCMDRLGENFDRLVAKNHAARSRAKRVDDGLRFPRIEQHDDAGRRLDRANVSSQGESVDRPCLQTPTNDGNVWATFLDDSYGVFRCRGSFNHLNTEAFRSKSADKQLAV